jgi:hypothetical protein
LDLQKRQVYNHPPFFAKPTGFYEATNRLAYPAARQNAFAAGLTPALPQRRLTRQQLDDPATQEQIFYRHWR